MCVVLIFNGLTAQEQVSLWSPEDIPNHQKSDDQEEIRPGDIVFIKNVQTPTLQIFLPSKQNATGMAVLICPGGGYSGVAYDWEGTDYAKWFNSQGIAAFVLKYRMPQAKSVVTSYKAPIQDAQRAMRYIRFHAEKFNVNKHNVGVIGSSAGGHLAATLSTHFNTTYYPSSDLLDNELIRPDFQMLIYPVISMKEGITHMGSRKNLLGKTPSEELILQFSNELHITENTPTTFIVHSGNDNAVPVENAIKMYQSLVKHKVKATMHIYPEGGHGYSLGKSKKRAPDWTTLASEWLSSEKNND